MLKIHRVLYLMLFTPWVFAVHAMADPIPIDSCESLLDLPNKTTLHYQLVQDIDCTGYEVQLPKVFSGILDGQNYRIHHLTLNPQNGYQAGLFSTIIAARVQRLHLDSFTVNTSKSKLLFAGLLAGRVERSIIKEVSITQGSFHHAGYANYPEARYGIGLLAGEVKASHLMHIQVKDSTLITTTSSELIGGIIGVIRSRSLLEHITIEDTQIDVRYGLNPQGKYHIGGLIGYLGDQCKVQYALLRSVTLQDANQGEHAGGIGMIAGYMRPYSRIHKIALQNNKLELIPLDYDHVAHLIGQMNLHSHLRHVCFDTSPVSFKRSFGSGRIARVLHQEPCTFSTESLFPSMR